MSMNSTFDIPPSTSQSDLPNPTPASSKTPHSASQYNLHDLQARPDMSSANPEGLHYDGLQDKLQEECGVFGVFNHPDASALTALGLHALQHRGQEACGIVSFDQEKAQFNLERHLGRVGDNFSQQDRIEQLSGKASIGHVRYSTTGEPHLRNVQPLFAELDTGGIAVCHNGNFTNAMTLRQTLISKGAIFQSTSDTEVVLHLISRSDVKRMVDKFIDAISLMEGAYSLVALTNKKLVGARDPWGIRPLVLGKLDDSYILTSETCALDIIGAKYVRDIENGEVIVIDENGIHSLKPFAPRAERLCIFEYVYFSRPDSVIAGRSVYEVRKNMGRQMAKEAPIEADLVVPVPDSGVPAALGYAEQSGINFDLGIIRNHYVGRTFIEPTQQIRALGVRLKHSANRKSVEGKRVVLIDDSIVRGTTSTKIVQMMRDAGAAEVHFCVASPPIKFGDYYGIDTPDPDRLLANQYDLEGMCNFIGCDSLSFLTIDGLYRALVDEPRNKDLPQFTDHAFTGDYPTTLTDLNTPDAPVQLSLLREVG